MWPVHVGKCGYVHGFGDDASGDDCEYEEEEDLKSEVKKGGRTVSATGEN